MRKLHLFQWLIIVAIIGGIGLPHIQERVGMYPGTVHINYLTYFDEYEAEANVTYNDGSTEILSNGSNEYRFFSPDIERMSFQFHRKALAGGSDFTLQSRSQS